MPQYLIYYFIINVFFRLHLPQALLAVVLTQHNHQTQDENHRRLQSAQLVQLRGGKGHLRNPTPVAGLDQCLRNLEKNCKYALPYNPAIATVLCSQVRHCAVIVPLSMYVGRLLWNLELLRKVFVYWFVSQSTL